MLRTDDKADKPCRKMEATSHDDLLADPGDQQLGPVARTYFRNRMAARYYNLVGWKGRHKQGSGCHLLLGRRATLLCWASDSLVDDGYLLFPLSLRMDV